MGRQLSSGLGLALMLHKFFLCFVQQFNVLVGHGNPLVFTLRLQTTEQKKTEIKQKQWTITQTSGTPLLQDPLMMAHTISVRIGWQGQSI